MKKFIVFLVLVLFGTGICNAQSWYSKYRDPLTRSLKNESFEKDFAQNIKRIVLCHVSTDRKGFYPDILNEALRILEKKGYEVEVVWFNKGLTMHFDSKFYRESVSKDDVAFMDIICQRISHEYLVTDYSEKTVGRVTDGSGRTIYEVRKNVPVEDRVVKKSTAMNVFLWLPEYKLERIGIGSKAADSGRDEAISLLRKLLGNLPAKK